MVIRLNMRIPFALALALMAGLLHADVIAPGEHGVDNRIFIDNIADYPEYSFVLYSVMPGGQGTLSQFNGTKMPGYYKFATATVFAIQNGDLPQALSSQKPPEGAIGVDAPRQINTLPDSDPRTEIDTHYSVKIQDGRMTLTEISEPFPPPNPSGKDLCPSAIVLPLFALGVGLLAGFVAGKKL